MLRHYKTALLFGMIAFISAIACRLTGENDCTAAVVYGFVCVADIICKTKSLLRRYLAAEEKRRAQYDEDAKQFQV